jgi:hypothetical protein
LVAAAARLRSIRAFRRERTSFESHERPLPTVVTTYEIELDHGERQLWAGVPRQGVVFRSTDVLLLPFSLMWGGFAVFWEFTAIAHGAGLFFVLWGVPFVLVGLYLIVGRFVVDAVRRAKTVYVVTSDRVVIRTGTTNIAVTSLPLRSLADMTLQERADGNGTIVFGAGNAAAFVNIGWTWPGVPRVPAFEMIPDAVHVYKVIRDAQADVQRQAV